MPDRLPAETVAMVLCAGFALASPGAAGVAEPVTTETQQVRAVAQEPEAGSNDQASDQAESKAAADASEEVPVLTLPPGFKAKKRGDVTLYCTKGNATGTRFQTESCYDEAQLRDYLLAGEQNDREFDRTRAICTNPSVCAPQ